MKYSNISRYAPRVFWKTNDHRLWKYEILPVAESEAWGCWEYGSLGVMGVWELGGDGSVRAWLNRNCIVRCRLRRLVYVDPRLKCDLVVKMGYILHIRHIHPCWFSGSFCGKKLRCTHTDIGVKMWETTPHPPPSSHPHQKKKKEKGARALRGNTSLYCMVPICDSKCYLCSW